MHKSLPLFVTVVQPLPWKQIMGMSCLGCANLWNSSPCSWDFIADCIIQHGTSLCSIFFTKTPPSFLPIPSLGTRMPKCEKEGVSKHCSATIKTLGFYQCCFNQKSRAPFRLLQKMLILSQTDAVHFLFYQDGLLPPFLESSSSRQCFSPKPSWKCASCWQQKVNFNEPV